MIKATISLKDMDGFDAQLAEVMEAVNANLNEVATIVFDAAKTSSAFRDKTGNLRMSIKKRKSRFEDGGYIVAARGTNKGDEKGYHAHLVEFGHVKFLWGYSTGERVAAHPFMRPAKEVGIRAAVKLFRSGK